MAESLSPPEETTESNAPKRHLLSRLVDVALWVAVAGVLAMALSPKNSGPRVGSSAAAHELALVDPNAAPQTVQIPGRLERPLLIEAFASWCGACRRNSGTLNDLESAKTNGKLDVVAISLDDSVEDALLAKRQWPIAVDVLHDATGAFARDYQVDVLPTYILVGVDGTVKRVTAGSPGASDIRAWLHESEN